MSGIEDSSGAARCAARVAFGFTATSVALKARSGCLRMRDQLQLAQGCMEWVGDDKAARDAVLSFLATCCVNAPVAGQELQDFVLTWTDGAIDPKAPETLLKKLENEFGEFEWQRRADLR